MKKLVRTSLVNTPNRRGIKDLNIQFYSHDKNNAGFEFVIKNETDLSEYTAKVLFHFVLSDSTWESTGTVEGNVVKATFNTDLIARCEEVLGFLFLDSESNSLDVFKFKFNVVLSEVDKNEVEKRKIKHVADIEALELVTRSELRDELAKLQVTGGVDLSGYLTTTTAEATYVKKTDLPAPYNDSALVQKIGQLEARVDNDTVYDDTHLRERLDTLEAKQDKDTVYDDTNIKERLTNLESKPTVDTSNFVTNTTLEEKHYVTNEQISSTYATKSEIPQPYSDIELVKRITVLENRQDNDTVYDDAELKRRVTALEEKPSADTSNFVTTAVLESKGYLTTHQDTSNFALKSELPQPYNDSVLASRVSALESKQDKDTIYNDTEVKQRLTALESKPTVDTSNFVTKNELNTLRPIPTLSINNNTLSIAGGNSVILPTNQWEIHGTGFPNGVVEAEIGTTYVDKNKTNGALKWIKTTDGGNTGWEVLIGDTGWRTLNSVSRAGNSFIKIRRVNNLVTYQFGGLQWGWFGVNRRNGPDFVRHNSSGDKGAKVLRPGGIPVGFRSESSLIGGIYSDAGKPYGIWYLGGTSDSNFIQFTFNDPIPTDKDIGDIRVSAISYLTNEPWPTQLP